MIKDALALLPLWEQKPITRADVLMAARDLKTLAYNPEATFALYFGNTVTGYTNCYGLLFLIVSRLGLMHGQTFWRAWQQGVALVGVPLLLRAYLGRELRALDSIHADAGDVLLFRWQGISPYGLSEEELVQRGHHHVAIVTQPDPLCVIQATDTGPNSSGVFESPLSSHDGAQIMRAATFPQFSL